MTKYTIHTDGGSRGNPGPAAIGVVIAKDGVVVSQFGKTIGVTTNNVAEYSAVIAAFEQLSAIMGKDFGSVVVDFYLDSLLVVNQLRGLFKIKDARLGAFVLSIRTWEQKIQVPISYHAIPREQNQFADRLVNQALDGQL